MIGFGVILIIIGVIILIVFSLIIGSKKTSSSNSLLLSSFVLSSLDTDSLCYYNYRNLSLRELIINCNKDEGICENNGKNLCLMLNETLKGMVGNGFQVGNSSYYKAYEIVVKMDDKQIKLTNGNNTKSYYNTIEGFSRGGSNYVISLKLFV